MKEENLRKARILIVDDEQVNIELLECTLVPAGYTNYLTTTDPRQVLPLYGKFQPDLILLDLMMPHLDGFAVLQQIGARIPEGNYLPILVLTAETNSEARQRALSTGANDFLTKPFDRTEVLLRVKNLLETRFLHLRLQEQNQTLEEKVQQHTGELREARMEILHRLAMTSEYREDPTGEHPKRVGETSAVLARAIGLPKTRVELIRLAAALHDIGKVGIPENLLLKPDKLTPEEYEHIKTHTVIGARMLSGSQVPLLQLAEEIALYHHERWDGSGYAHLEGEAIPIAARIVAIADTFDVLTHERPYRGARLAREAAEEIRDQSGRQFEPRLVNAFLRWRRHEEMPSLMERVLGV